ncbi:hypothetical protein ACYSUO_15450 [Streptomyces sp. UC4497]
MGAASVAVVCVSAGAVVALDGGDGRDGYVAVGAAGAAPTSPGDRVAPTGKVELVPLDSPAAKTPGAPDPSEKGAAGRAGGDRAGADGAGGDNTGGAKAGGQETEADAPDAGGAPPAGETPGESGAPSAADKPSGNTAPDSDAAPSSSGPAVLKVAGDPELKKADKRWCQDVTLTLHNSGGSAVRSGTATFETHVIGALGIDWATVDVKKKLPVPIGAGEKKRKTWTVCVDEWRVPLGMRLETKDVDVDWK